MVTAQCELCLRPLLIMAPPPRKQWGRRRRGVHSLSFICCSGLCSGVLALAPQTRPLTKLPVPAQGPARTFIPHPAGARCPRGTTHLLQHKHTDRWARGCFLLIWSAGVCLSRNILVCHKGWDRSLPSLQKPSKNHCVAEAALSPRVPVRLGASAPVKPNLSGAPWALGPLQLLPWLICDTAGTGGPWPWTTSRALSAVASCLYPLGLLPRPLLPALRLFRAGTSCCPCAEQPGDSQCPCNCGTSVSCLLFWADGALQRLRKRGGPSSCWYTVVPRLTLQHRAPPQQWCLRESGTAQKASHSCVW